MTKVTKSLNSEFIIHLPKNLAKIRLCKTLSNVALISKLEFFKYYEFSSYILL